MTDGGARQGGRDEGGGDWHMGGGEKGGSVCLSVLSVCASPSALGILYTVGY